MHVHQGQHLQSFIVILRSVIWMSVLWATVQYSRCYYKTTIGTTTKLQFASTQQNSCLVACTDDSQISTVFAAFVARQGQYSELGNDLYRLNLQNSAWQVSRSLGFNPATLQLGNVCPSLWLQLCCKTTRIRNNVQFPQSYQRLAESPTASDQVLGLVSLSHGTKVAEGTLYDHLHNSYPKEEAFL